MKRADARPGRAVRYSAAGAPGAAIDSVSELFVWTPRGDQSGSHSVTFTADVTGIEVVVTPK